MENQNAQAEPQTEPEPKPQASTGSGQSASIEPQASSAAGRTAEDTLDGYRSLLNQMEAQNKALLEQNRSLQNQFGILIRSGAHVGQYGSGDPVSGSGTGSLLDPVQDSGQNEPQEPYVSLAELGKEIGKRDYGSHNTQKE
jgi:hypothetical protein|nr:MAG TPA: hypothetical protein [Bacteriophage sp.]